MTRVYIGVGGNLGNPRKSFQTALQLLPPAVQVIRSSSLYTTEPWGVKDQPQFLNAVWEAETKLQPDALLSYLKSIEAQMGRVTLFRYGPRLIDLDILLYGSEKIETPQLTIPHARLNERRFALVPLCELIPDDIDPKTGLTWRQVLSSAPESEIEKAAWRLSLKSFTFDPNTRPYVMGIVNLTPDSFSGDGFIRDECVRIDDVIEKCGTMIADGADILDLGAESTRPGFTPVPEEVELKRLIPVFTEIRKSFPETILSVDSRKIGVIQEAAQQGADWINYTGDLRDKTALQSCAALKKQLVLMRSQPIRQEPCEFVSTEMLVERIHEQFLNALDCVQSCQGTDSQPILDPGIGFGSSSDLDLGMIRSLHEICTWEYPILIGPSRKSFIGGYLQRDRSDRLAGTAAVIVEAVLNGVSVVRVHDVKFIADVVRMARLIR